MKTRLELTKDRAGRFEPYAWPGGYPILYVLEDGAGLCSHCANGENGSDASDKPGTDTQWHIIGFDILEGSAEDYDGPVECDHCYTILIPESRD